MRTKDTNINPKNKREASQFIKKMCRIDLKKQIITYLKRKNCVSDQA